MNFEYIGSKAVISQHSISFKQGKYDKYLYLPYVYEILNAINNDYDVNKNYSYSVKIDKSNIDKLYKKLLGLNPYIENEINLKLEIYKIYLKNKYKEIENRKNLNEIEKKTYINNLEYMETYRINRAKNKIFYYSSIYCIANIIKNKKIKKLYIPFDEKFWHVLKTLQGVLSKEKVSTNLITEEKNNSINLVFTTSL